jgi:hypothetical protein
MSDVFQRTEELRGNPHLQEQVRRIMEPLRLIQGLKDSRNFEEVLGDVAFAIAALENTPDVEQTANHGGITVMRGPRQGYSLHLWAVDVYHMNLAHQREKETP